MRRLLERHRLVGLPAPGCVHCDDQTALSCDHLIFSVHAAQPAIMSWAPAFTEPSGFAPPHSITSSAVARSVGGTVRPSAFAVLRLITSSNLTGNWMGRSLGFSPFNIRSTKVAARRQLSVKSFP